MLGAIIGDVIGSTYEFRSVKTKAFDLLPADSGITDDGLLTLAVGAWVLDGTDLVESFHEAVTRFPHAGWGGRFRQWANMKNREPYNSFGNGSAMRVAPVGWAFDTLERTVASAEESAAVTHNHPEGVRGAVVVAGAIFLARKGREKDEIRSWVRTQGYQVSSTVDEVRAVHSFDETCQGSVPEAVIAFLDSSGYEDAVRNAVSLGGDADTQACIAGSIAEAFYGGVPIGIRSPAMSRLPEDLRARALEQAARLGVPMPLS